MRALVTGASGFIGSHLIRRLHKDNWEVFTLGRSTSHELRAQVEQVRPDVTFHLASRFLAEHTSDDISDLIESNVAFGTHLVDALVQNQCHHLVVAGTAWQNFAGLEGTGVCLYGATKEAFEAILRYYCNAFALNASVLKIYDTYGPSDPRGKLLSHIRKAARAGSKLGLSPGEQRVDLLYVTDVVNAFMVAAERLQSGQDRSLHDYYLRSGEVLSVRELVQKFCAVTGAQFEAEWAARPYRAREVMEPWSQGEVLPGWRPQMSLAEGLRAYMDEVRHV